MLEPLYLKKFSRLHDFFTVKKLIWYRLRTTELCITRSIVIRLDNASCSDWSVGWFHMPRLVATLCNHPHHNFTNTGVRVYRFSFSFCFTYITSLRRCFRCRLSLPTVLSSRVSFFITLAHRSNWLGYTNSLCRCDCIYTSLCKGVHLFAVFLATSKPKGKFLLFSK